MDEQWLQASTVAKSVRFHIGCPVVWADGRTDLRHVTLKISLMDRSPNCLSNEDPL